MRKDTRVRNTRSSKRPSIEGALHKRWMPVQTEVKSESSMANGKKAVDWSR